MTSGGVSKVINAMALTKNSETGNAAERPNGFDQLLNQKTADNGSFMQQPPSAAESFASQKSELLPAMGNADQTKQTYEKETGTAAWDRIPKASEKQPEQVMTEEMKSAYGEWKEKLKKLFSEKLGVSEEELAAAMEQLGITFENLLMGEGFQELGMELTGAADITDLLFHGGFQELMQEANLLLAQLSEQVDLSPQELQALIQEFGTMDAPEDAEMTVNPDELPEGQIPETGMEEEAVPPAETGQQKVPGQTVTPEAPQTETQQKAPETAVQQKVQETVVQETPEENPQDKGALDTEQLQGVVETEKQAGAQEELQQELSQEEQKSFSSQLKTEAGKEQGPETSQNSQTASFQTTVQNTVAGTGETVQTVQTTYVDVQDILRQVSEFTRVTVTRNISTIEMQLNPEHLGKLFMQLSSKEGVITAQLVAQNEAVRQALESQMNVLKENMNEQGMKVEAVEVTVASHEFEEQFQNGQQMDSQQEEHRGRSQRRFLNVEQLDERAGQLSEEDSLAAKIMVENGNSMDMTA